MLLAPQTTAAAALQLADRLQAELAELGTSGQWPITVSIGISDVASAKGADADELLRDADRALYRAKKAGRNQVIVAPRSSLTPPYPCSAHL